MTQLEQEQDRFLQKVVDQIHQQKWRVPVLFVLEVGQPLAFLGGQFLWIAQPTLSLIWSGKQVGQWACLLESPAGVSRLLSALEAKA